METLLLLPPSRRVITQLRLRLRQTTLRQTSTQPNRYNYNPDDFSEGETLKQLIHQHFTTDTGGIKLYQPDQLARFNHPPKPSICLARDFIHDSLYNPNYGYFFNQVEIFDPPHQSLQNSSHGSKNLEEHLYAEYFHPATAQQQNQLFVRRQSLDCPHHQHDPSSSEDQRQIWHTPTELFKPWYAWSMASLIVEKHLEEVPRNAELKKKGLKIYEIGAGNGTLCCGIMDYIREHHPSLYVETRYTTIELSTRLARRQREKISESGHEAQARVVCRSILDMVGSSELAASAEPCWVLGMEVLDNLPRDVVRRERTSGQMLQSIVITDQHGDMHERFIPITPENNPLLLDYLHILYPHLYPQQQQQQANTKKLHILWEKFLATYLPFRANLSPHQFIPSNYLALLRTVFHLFPNHRLVLSDFSHLDNTLNDPRRNRFGAPVVQTRYNGVTVPASTFLVKPGMFDIFFPTDFDELRRLYTHLYHQAHPSSSSDDDDSSHNTNTNNTHHRRPEISVQSQSRFLQHVLHQPHMRQLIISHKTAGRSLLDVSQIPAYYHNVKILTVI
ncbi:hypothetical protein VP01_276g14 [Puccinia sorghi]|uniref:Protein arginine methyltransferase NDUFAF7 n=1 Tax=Puccinia sorghi TaxID=27349 RepID=A0A0L6V2U6_9BASI|nr:hypothetical protein VP01_276g14 [Puccinia sorghi]